MSLQDKIYNSIVLLLRSERMAREYDPENGFYLAFSGGKDSLVLYHLARMAGVKFKAHMNLTSIDPPDVIRFVKQRYPSVELIKPKMSIYDMALKKHILPTRFMRWCCAEYKEMSGAGKVTLIGIRKGESAKRSKRNEVETGNRKFSGNFDQFSEHRETMVTCVNGKDKILVSPILNWMEGEVWEFIHRYKVPYCKLYDEGYSRIGCILCPMSNRKQKLKDIRRFPHVKRKWVQTIQKLIDAGYLNHNFSDAEFGFNWWISDKGFDHFYADEVLQQKIQF